MMTRWSWRAGRRYILPPAVLGGLLLLSGRRSGWFSIVVSALLSLFFRDPPRRTTPDPALVYAAADGLVTKIEESAHEPWMPQQQGIRIATFLNLQNVHVNRSPVAGQLTQVESIGGGFAPALFPSADDNARRRVAIDGPAGRVVVVQVSGLLVRKISGWVDKGDRVAAGDRIGMIHFGSRTDVLLPVGSADLLVRPGQRVRAGITPLARYRDGA